MHRAYRRAEKEQLLLENYFQGGYSDIIELNPSTTAGDSITLLNDFIPYQASASVV